VDGAEAELRLGVELLGAYPSSLDVASPMYSIRGSGTRVKRKTTSGTRSTRRRRAESLRGLFLGAVELRDACGASPAYGGARTD
jgi:hypothetical protein